MLDWEPSAAVPQSENTKSDNLNEMGGKNQYFLLFSVFCNLNVFYFEKDVHSGRWMIVIEKPFVNTEFNQHEQKSNEYFKKNRFLRKPKC